MDLEVCFRVDGYTLTKEDIEFIEGRVWGTERGLRDLDIPGLRRELAHTPVSKASDEHVVALIREILAHQTTVRYGIRPVMTVDGLIILSGEEIADLMRGWDQGDGICLIKRGKLPYKGMYAIPGGFVEYGETTGQAAVREVEEETGLKTEITGLVGVFSDPKRDPRWHTITTAYHLEFKGGELRGGDDAAEARFLPVDDLPSDIAFDHHIIIEQALNNRH